MAYKRVILDAAESERDKIVAYLVSVAGSAGAAASFLDGMDSVVNLICEFPTMHALSRMPELAERGYRAALFGSYVMLYTFSDDTVYIEHVFRQRQDCAHLV